MKLKRQEIIDLVRGAALTMDELISAVKEKHEDMTPAEIKSVILPLIASTEIELTPERKLAAAAVPAGV